MTGNGALTGEGDFWGVGALTGDGVFFGGLGATICSADGEFRSFESSVMETFMLPCLEVRSFLVEALRIELFVLFKFSGVLICGKLTGEVVDLRLGVRLDVRLFSFKGEITSSPKLTVNLDSDIFLEEKKIYLLFFFNFISIYKNYL